MFMILLPNPLKRDLQIRICQCDCDSHSGSGNNLSPFNLVTTTEKKHENNTLDAKKKSRNTTLVKFTTPIHQTVHLSRQKILENEPLGNPENSHRCFHLPTQYPRPSRNSPGVLRFLAWLPTPAAPFGADLTTKKKDTTTMKKLFEKWALTLF